MTWALANLAIGYLVAFPLLAVVILGYQVRTALGGTGSAPFRAGEADVATLFVLSTGVPLAVLAVLVNRALRRRLAWRRWRALAFWAATLAVLIGPFAAFALTPDLTVAQMLGKGLLW